jgi:dihydrofolate reductase
MEDEFPRFIATVGAIAMGSTTYEWIADHTGFLNDPTKWEYNLPTWVFSSRELPRVEGPDISFVSGDVAPVHQEMVRAAEGRHVWLVGGGDLVGQFHDQGLLDEVIIGVASVFLGAGAPLLPRRIVTPPLQLLEATAYGADFAMLRYAVPRASAL